METKKLFIVGYFLICFLATFTLTAAESAIPSVVIEPTPKELCAKGGGEFSMVFKGFPVDEEIVMSYAHVIQKNPGEYKEVERFKIDNAGRLWIKGELVSFYTFGALGIAKGERVKYKFARTDGTLLTETSFIPYPLVVQGKKKTFSIEIELLALEPAAYTISYSGLINGERLRLRSFSGGELLEDDFFYRADQPSLYMPGVAGESGGYAFLDVFRLGGGDVVKVRVPWGIEVLRSVIDALPEADAAALLPPPKKPKPFRSR